LSSSEASRAISSVAVTSSAPSGSAQLAGDNVAREVTEDRRQVKPPAADGLEISEVCLPELIWRLGPRCMIATPRPQANTGDCSRNGYRD
jgi:hypothetical protein